MKKLYLLAASLITLTSFAQSTISFETSEGYTAGNINGQKSWVTTGTGSTPPNITNQVISSEDKTDGSNSLKLTKESAFTGQSSTIVGAFDNLATSLPYNNFTVSFDMKITDQSASSSDFAFAAVNTTVGKYVVWLRFQYDGKVMAASTAWNDTGATWNTNTWYRFKVVGTGSGITYYINDNQVYTDVPMTTNPISQIRFVHDNYGGNAYVDNIKINNESLAVDSFDKKNEKLTVFPNPTVEYLNLKTSTKIKNIEVFDVSGKKVDVKLDGEKVDVRKLSVGSYLINVETEGRNYTEKFIKK